MAEFNGWEGERVRLRAPELRDLDALVALERDAELTYLGSLMRPPRGTEEVRRWIEDPSKQSPPGDDVFLVIETLDGDFAGTISTRDARHRLGNFDYGISIVREQQGKGYGNEALRLLLAYFFGELRYLKANGQVFAFNEASQRFHERFGFQLEGRIRDGWYANGRSHDVLWYGMTAAEFTASYGKQQGA